MAKINEVERRILDGMTGADQLKALMREAGYETYRDFARYLGRYIEEVSRACVSRGVGATTTSGTRLPSVSA